MPSATQSPATRRGYPAALKLAALVVILAAAFLTARHFGVFRYRDLPTAAAAIRDLRARPNIVPLFVAAYVVATAVGLPGTILTLAGGAMFGFGLGTLLNWTGATLGATAAYLLARALGRDAFAGLLGKHGKSLDELAGEHGFLTLLRLRLIPVVPFNVLNFAAGLAGVPVRSFVGATALGIIPGTAVYTYFADSLLAGAEGARQTALIRVAIAGGLLVLLSFVPAIARKLGWLAPAAAALIALAAAPTDGRAQGRPVNPAVPPKAGSAQPRGSTFDHSAFDALLRAHVVNGLVDYDAFKAAPEFAAYLRQLATVDAAALSDDERLAFWINVYNAYTIQLINAKGERRSIRDINKSLGVLKLKGPWSERLVQVGGRALSLDDVEHRIIRKDFAEPRIHLALVCAAMGCPPLRGEAYVGSRLDAQLDDQGVAFLLKSPGKNRVDVASRTVYASMIFTFYKDDFGDSDAGVGRFIARWYPDGPEKQLLTSGAFKLRKTDYDWTLNSQARAKAAGVATVNR